MLPVAGAAFGMTHRNRLVGISIFTKTARLQKRNPHLLGSNQTKNWECQKDPDSTVRVGALYSHSFITLTLPPSRASQNAAVRWPGALVLNSRPTEAHHITLAKPTEGNTFFPTESTKAEQIICQYSAL